jgi:hypothetical protein
VHRIARGDARLQFWNLNSRPLSFASRPEMSI